MSFKGALNDAVRAGGAGLARGGEHAHLAALAIEHGAELCSCDAGVPRFSGQRWVDPLRD